jgi:hypothetical protein
MASVGSVDGIISRYEGFDADSEQDVPAVWRAQAETSTVPID